MKLNIFETSKKTTNLSKNDYKLYNNVKLTNEFNSIIKLILIKYITDNISNQKLDENWKSFLSDFIINKTDNHNLFILLAQELKETPHLGKKFINFLLNSQINEKDNSLTTNINISDNCSLSLKFLKDYSKNILSNIVETKIIINNNDQLVVNKNVENKEISIWYDKDFLINGVNIFLKSAKIEEKFLKEYQIKEKENQINRINLLNKKFFVENNLTDVLVAIIERESFKGQEKLSKIIEKNENDNITFEYDKSTNSFSILKKTNDSINIQKNTEIVCKGEFLNRKSMTISYNKNYSMHDILKINNIIQNFIQKSSYIYPKFNWIEINTNSFKSGKTGYRTKNHSEFYGCYQPIEPIYLKINKQTLNLMKKLKQRKDIEFYTNENKTHQIKISIDKDNINIQLNGKNQCRFNINKSVYQIGESERLLCNIYFLVDEKNINTIINNIDINNLIHNNLKISKNKEYEIE